jgi:hypothetical protein
VSHSDPLVPNTSGDGLSDLYKYLHGLPPNETVAVPTLEAINPPTCPVP